MQMAKSTVISIEKLDCMDYKSWSFEIEILLEQKHILRIISGTEGAPDTNDGTVLKVKTKQPGIAQLMILLLMGWSWQLQYGIQKAAKSQWYQMKEDYNSHM